MVIDSMSEFFDNKSAFLRERLQTLHDILGFDIAFHAHFIQEVNGLDQVQVQKLTCFAEG
jgi:hypothetical protein